MRTPVAGAAAATSESVVSSAADRRELRALRGFSATAKATERRRRFASILSCFERRKILHVHTRGEHGKRKSRSMELSGPFRVGGVDRAALRERMHHYLSDHHAYHLFSHLTHGGYAIESACPASSQLTRALTHEEHDLALAIYLGRRVRRHEQR